MKPKVTKYLFAVPRSFRSQNNTPVLFKFEGTPHGKDGFNLGYMSRQFSYSTIILLSRFSDTPEEAHSRYIKELVDSVKNAEIILEDARRNLAAAPSSPGEATEENRGDYEIQPRKSVSRSLPAGGHRKPQDARRRALLSGAQNAPVGNVFR